MIEYLNNQLKISGTFRLQQIVEYIPVSCALETVERISAPASCSSAGLLT